MSETTYRCPSCGERAVSTAHSCAVTPGYASTAGPTYVPPRDQPWNAPAPSPPAAHAALLEEAGALAGALRVIGDRHGAADLLARLTDALRAAAPSPGAGEVDELRALVLAHAIGWCADPEYRGYGFVIEDQRATSEAMERYARAHVPNFDELVALYNASAESREDEFDPARSGADGGADG